MKALTRVITVLLLCCLFFSSCTKEETIVIEELNAESIVKYVEIEKEIINLINEYRISKNLHPLEKLNVISKEAENHTLYMISNNKVSHDDFSNRVHNLMNNTGAVSVAENVGYGYHTAKGIVNAWLESKSHKENIEGNYTETGISAKRNKKGDYYYTNIFIRR